MTIPEKELIPAKRDSGLFDVEELEDADPSFAIQQDDVTGEIRHVDSDGGVLPEAEFSSDDEEEEEPRVGHRKWRLPDSDDECDVQDKAAAHDCKDVHVQKAVDRIEEDVKKSGRSTNRS